MSIPVTESGKAKMKAELEEMEAQVPVVRKAIEEVTQRPDVWRIARRRWRLGSRP